MGFIGWWFTWENKQDGRALINERLDRAVANNIWMGNFPDSSVHYLRMEELDHCPISILSNKRAVKGTRPFRFLHAWTTDDSSIQVINEAWNLNSRGRMHNHRLMQSLNATTKALRKWNREIFGFAQFKIKDLEGELETLQRNNVNHDRQRTILANLKEQRSMLELIHRQKSRELWLKEGDENSKFFQLSTVIRRRKNKVDAIKEGPNWIHGDEIIGDYFRDKFKELFHSQHSRLDFDFESLLTKRISNEDNYMLSGIPSAEEIKVYGIFTLSRVQDQMVIRVTSIGSIGVW